MPEFLLTVNGVERNVALPTLSVQHIVNGPDILEADIQDEDGTIDLEPDQVVVLTNTSDSPSTVYFEGLLQTKGNQTWTGWGYARLRKITAFDYSIYTTFVDASLTTDGASSLEDALTDLVTDYLTDYGVTMHPSQATGPTLSANAFAGVKAQAILNSLSEQTGWVWKIDADKQLRMWDPAAESAPFNVTATNETYVRDIETNTLRQRSYNRVFVEGGEGYLTITNEQHFGDSSARTFLMNAPMHYYEVDYTGSLGFMVGLTLLVYRTGGTTVEYANDQNTAQWRFNPAPDYSLSQVSGATLGPTEYIEIPAYAAQYPMRLVADGRGSPPDPARDLTLMRPMVFGRDAIQAIADTVLAASAGDFERITYPTTVTTIRPGQTQTVNVPEADVNGTYTVTDARLRYESGGSVSEFWLDITAVNEVTARSQWLNLLDRWLTDNQGTNTAGPNAVGNVVPTLGTSPGAPNQSVQFNEAGTFGGDAEFIYDTTGKAVTVESTDAILRQRGVAGGTTYGNAANALLITRKAAQENITKLEPAGLPTVFAQVWGSALMAAADFLTLAISSAGSAFFAMTGSINFYARNLRLITTYGPNIIMTSASGGAGNLELRTGGPSASIQYSGQMQGVWIREASKRLQAFQTTDYTFDSGVGSGGTHDGSVLFKITTAKTCTLPALASNFYTVDGSYFREFYITNSHDSTAILTIDPNGSELIQGLATIALIPGQSVQIRAGGGSFIGWRIIASHMSATAGQAAWVTGPVITTTDAQVKALPTTAKLVIPAVASGYRIADFRVDAQFNFGTAVYTNVDPDATLGLRYVGSLGDSNYLKNDSAIPRTFLSDVFEATGQYACVFQPFTYAEPVSDRGNLVIPMGKRDNVGVELYLDNNGAGNLTGGNGAHTIVLTPSYYFVPVS